MSATRALELLRYDWLTRKEIAERCGVTTTTAERWIESLIKDGLVTMRVAYVPDGLCGRRPLEFTATERKS